MQIETIFGVALPAAHTMTAVEAGALAARMTAAAAALRQEGASAAAAADARRDAQRYLAARRHGDLRLPGFSARRACDEAARALMQITVDAPPVRAARTTPLVA